jgi:hypothetical protein
MTNTPGTTVPPWLAPHTHQLAAEQRAWFTGGSLTENQLRGPQTP